mgnify:FL=1
MRYLTNKSMSTIIRFLPILLIQFLSLFSFAQTDSIALKNDSLNTSLLNAFNKKIKLIEINRIEDSIKKEKLENQLNSLQTTDNLKKEELQKQLAELKEKDTQRLKEKINRIDSLRNTAKKYPVFGFFNDTLFNVFTKS